ncbi:hypothetical protein V5F44_01805 [Xanthobacter sp. V2C-8]|jgi:hypothetical protein|uniref:hypothetical protein n=1 Tax=Xanthobacter albus TaxID=3119929 RepID=UPI00372B14E3
MMEQPFTCDMHRETVPGGLLSATVTPLASIFGSGFLVIAAILTAAVGRYAVFAMAGICALAYAIGMVMRHNIRHVEPLLFNRKLPAWPARLELVSDFSLVLAYVISVTLYLRIMASFALNLAGADSQHNQSLLVSGCIAVILAFALWKGLKSLEFLEKWALILTMAIVLVLLATFVKLDASVLTEGVLKLPQASAETPLHALLLLGGTVIVVQGFETTRYLGEHYCPETRIRASRLSQIVSTIVYVAFIALVTPHTHLLDGVMSDSGLLDIVKQVATWLVLPLVGAAIFSQFSAAIADTIGGTGNVRDRTDGKVSERAIYAVILSVALILAWSADTAQVLVLASKAFAFYYGLQCAVAAIISSDTRIRLGATMLAAVMFAITVFAIPVG